MKLKVLLPFIDKKTGVEHIQGEIIEVNNKRGKEILESPYNVAELLNEEVTEQVEEDKE